MPSLNNCLTLKNIDISSKINIFGTYVLYMSIKTHFKLNSTFNVTMSLLQSIKEPTIKNRVYFAAKTLSEKYSSNDIILILIENELNDSNNLMSLDHKSLLHSIKYRLSNLDRILIKDFENIIKYCMMNNISLQTLLSSDRILKMYLKQYISPETVICIDSLTNLLILPTDDILLPTVKSKLLNYKKLFLINKDLIKDVIKRANNVCINDEL